MIIGREVSTDIILIIIVSSSFTCCTVLIVTTYFTVLTVYFRYLKSLPYTLQIFLDSVQLATHARLCHWLRRPFLT